MVVSCGGGGAADYNHEIKRLYPQKVFALQLMDPDEGHSGYDLIVSPIFENKDVYSMLKNVLNVICMPSDYKKEVDGGDATKWKNWFNATDRKLTVLMVGGSSQFSRVTKDDIAKVAEMASIRAKKMGNGLFVITGPRTDAGFVDIIRTTYVKHNIKGLIS